MQHGCAPRALVGLSSSARWAIQVAAEHPERVTHLAMVDPAVDLFRSRRRARGVDLEMFHAEPIGGDGLGASSTPTTGAATTLSSWSISSASSPTTRIQPSRSRTGRLGAWDHAGDPDRDHGRECDTAHCRVRSAVRCPVLIVHGTNDVLVPCPRPARRCTRYGWFTTRRASRAADMVWLGVSRSASTCCFTSFSGVPGQA